MPVTEHWLDRVAADRVDALDRDFTLSGLEGLLSGAVAPDLGRWRIHPQILVRKLEMRPIIEAQFHAPGFLMEPYFGGDRGVFVESGHAW